MKRENSGPFLSAVFVDYDNIYLSLKRKNEDAAKRFAKDATVWLREIESGHIITPTNGIFGDVKRRIVLNRCYGNPVPRRNSHDNSTDMNSFPFVRHNFLRAGFEVVDCPPLTAQLKNSSDIRMVMDLRDYLTHDTYFDEFIILSGDADFTPVLHRLRQHARRTVIFANDHTAAPYTAICDGEIRESDLITLLIGSPTTITLPEANDASLIAAQAAPIQAMTLSPTPVLQAPALPPQHADPLVARIEEIRAAIIAEVVACVRTSNAPVPLEALADRATRVLGHEYTVGTGWAGTGGFRELLRQSLPPDVAMNDQPPYFAYDPQRHLRQEPPRRPAMFNGPVDYLPAAPVPHDPILAPLPAAVPVAHALPLPPQLQMPTRQPAPPAPMRLDPQPVLAAAPMPAAPPSQRSDFEPPAMRPAPRMEMPAPQQPQPQPRHQPAQAPPQAPPPRADAASAVHQIIARIHEACQAPPLAPPEYRLLFETMATELNENGLIGAQTLVNVATRARERGLDVGRDDVRFVLDVVSEADPWFEQGVSANLFAGRFRNFVVARCRSQGMNLSADELDLIEAWFAGGPMPEPAARAQAARAPQQPDAQARGGNRWWSADDARAPDATRRIEPQLAEDDGQDEFPRIVRSRVRG